ncbi:MAG: hypothetical protein WBU92_03525, partial [Candidatus Dormiibacterota bacterium]
ELVRALAVVDEAATTGNLARLGQALTGDALSEVQARFQAYQMAGIQVSPFRESLHLEVAPGGSSSSLWLRVRYRDRTSFMAAGITPASADDAVQLRVGVEITGELWRIASVSEE